MKPSERRQIPQGLYNLRFVNANADNSIIVYRGGYCKPSFTPFFENGLLRAVFFSYQNAFITTRLTVAESWPADRIYIDCVKLWKHCENLDLKALLLDQNRLAHCSLLDPTRDSRPLWAQDRWKREAYNIAEWTDATLKRIDALNENRATFFVDRAHDMEILGVIFGVIASIGFLNVTTVHSLLPYNSIIQKEAHAWLSAPHNYARMAQVFLATDLVDFPHTAFIKEDIIVKVDPFKNSLSHAINTPHSIMYKGFAYIGYYAFQAIARQWFMQRWKEFAVMLSKQMASELKRDSTQLSLLCMHEFMSNVCYQRRAPKLTDFLVKTSAQLLFPTVHEAAPVCVQSLFSVKPLKHYSRWQLAVLAVDMQWTLSDLLAVYPDKGANHQEVKSSYNLYKSKPKEKNLCKIYMSSKLCPFSVATYSSCSGVLASDDIEDMYPALNFHRRLKIINEK